MAAFVRDGLSLGGCDASAIFLVDEYVTYQRLGKAGFKFDGDGLDDFTFEAFKIIGNELATTKKT